VRTLFDVERNIFNGLLPESTYHCVLFTPYDSLTLKSDSALTGQESLAASNEIPPISCKLPQNLTRFIYLVWLHAEHDAFSNPLFDL
jgi:hypothetical protein